MAAVELDAVAGLNEGVQRAGLAVHAYAPCLDQLVGPAPRGDAGPREIGIEAHDLAITAARRSDLLVLVVVEPEQPAEDVSRPRRARPIGRRRLRSEQRVREVEDLAVMPAD